MAKNYLTHPPPPCQDGTRRVWGLWDLMVIFAADKFIGLVQFLSHTRSSWETSEIVDKTIGFDQETRQNLAGVKEEVWQKLVDSLPALRADCTSLGLRMTLAQLDRMEDAWNRRTETEGVSANMSMFEELVNRLKDELQEHCFLKIDPDAADRYLLPTKTWERVIERFGVHFDVEEASKCFALGRYTACVFHLMRVVETAVLRLQEFLDKPDPKAHFGSVIGKLERLNNKTEFNDLPERLKPCRSFLIGILPQLHAVKDSWRDKVSHVDGVIVPKDVFTEEMASGVYSATLLLMEKLVDGLPKRETDDALL